MSSIIAVECSVFSYPHGGLASFYRPLLQELFERLREHQFILVATQDSDLGFSNGLPNVRKIDLPPLKALFMSRGSRLRRMAIDLPSILLRQKADVLISPYYLFMIPPWMRGRACIGIHDTCFWDVPDFYSHEERHLHDRVLRWNLTWKPKVITVSQTSRQRILKHFPHLDGGDIEIVHNSWSRPIAKAPAPNAGSRLERLLRNAPDKLLLHSSGWGPVKNNQRLLEAFALAFGGRDDVGLLMTGNARYVDAAWKLMDCLDISDKVILTGVISDQEMDWLLRERCCGAVSVSQYEGFGRSCVEARRAGLPLVCSDIPTNHEVVGDYPFYCNAADVKEIAEAMVKLTNAQRLEPVMDERFAFEANYARYESIVRGLITGREGNKGNA